MRTVTLTKESTKDILENLLKRSPSSYGKYEMAVAQILDKVKQEKDQALFGYTKEFDKADITAENIKVTEEEIKEAYEQVDPSLLAVIRKALVNIRTYHEKQRQLVYQLRKRYYAGSEGNSTLQGGRLCTWGQGGLSVFCTDEYCSC